MVRSLVGVPAPVKQLRAPPTADWVKQPPPDFDRLHGCWGRVLRSAPFRSEAPAPFPPVAMFEPETTSEDHFLQRRVRLFGLLAGLLALSFWLFRALVILLAQLGSEWLVDPGMLTHLGSAIVLISLWFLLGGKARTARVVRHVELCCVSVASALLIVMGTYIPWSEKPDLIVVLALTIVLMARAVYVPSTTRQTALIGIFVGVVLLVAVYFGSLATLPDVSQNPSRGISTRRQWAVATTLSAGMWWVLSTSLAIATTRVIYGLRKQVGAIKRLGQYHLEGKLGAGGMGVVYRARHAMLRRETAVKLLAPERAGDAAVKRFEREVKLTARLKHPNTVTVFDYGRTPEGVFYYAMELLDGATLDEIVRLTGPLPPARVKHVLLQASGSLAEAHALGLIHRDIKPENLMLCNQGGELDFVKVLDFGLVKDVNRNESIHLTQDGSITGTPLYISPEALLAPDTVDARSDLYALGAVGYYLLVGEHVFTGKNLIEICAKHLNDTPIAPSIRAAQPIPAALEALILECLAKSPSERPPSAGVFAKRLRASVAEDWDADAARAWWNEHAVELPRTRLQPVSGSAQTIAIDFGQRQTPRSSEPPRG